MTTAKAADATRLDDLRMLVAGIVEKDEESIAPEADLVEEVGLDSVMRLELLAVIERKYAVKIQQDELKQLRCLNDVHRLLLDKRQGPA